MGRAKEIIVKVIPSGIANPFMKKHHYSGKVVNNSSLHFGCFLDGQLHGVLSYGPSLDKKKIMALVEGTGWNNFLELNRMAFDDYLPRNFESYCIGKTLRLIKKTSSSNKVGYFFRRWVLVWRRNNISCFKFCVDSHKGEFQFVFIA